MCLHVDLPYSGIHREAGPEPTTRVRVVFEEGRGVFYVDPQKWIGFDVDGTLSHAAPDLFPAQASPESLEAIDWILKSGIKVKLFTARPMSTPASPTPEVLRHILAVPANTQITATKDFDMLVCFDDRMIQMDPGTLRPLSFQM